MRSWLADGCMCGHRKITCDLREAGEGRHRVRRLMRREGLRAQIGCGSKPRHRGGPVGLVATALDWEFAPESRIWSGSRTSQGFFSALRKERIKQRIYPTRTAAALDTFDYIGMFYNSIRRHGFVGDLSLVAFERRYAQGGS